MKIDSAIISPITTNTIIQEVLLKSLRIFSINSNSLIRNKITDVEPESLFFISQQRQICFPQRAIILKTGAKNPKQINTNPPTQCRWILK